MKLTVKHWAGLLTVMFLLLLGPYFFKFHYSLSGNSQDWANFGTYIGGTLGPIGAFLAFWGLMQQNKMYRENAEIERLTTKLVSLDADISALTQKCSIETNQVVGQKSNSRLEALFGEGHIASFENIYKTVSLSDLSNFNEPAAKDIIISKSNNSNLTYTGVIEAHYSILQSLEKKLKLINDYVIKIQKINPENIEVVHYNEKYQYLLKEMHKKKWINFDSFGG